MKRFSLAAFSSVFLLFIPAFASAGPMWSTVQFTDAAGSGIKTSNVYTHVVDLQSPTYAGVNINGVIFGGGGQTGSNYSTSGTAGGEGPYHGATGLSKFFNEYMSGYYTPEAVTLSQLVVGKTYDARFYTSNVYLYTTAPEYVTATNGLTTDVDPDIYEPWIPGYDGVHPTYSYFQYEFTAQATSATVTFTPAQMGNSNQYELFGFSNQIAPAAVPEPGSGLVVALGSIALLYRRRYP